MFSHWIYFIKTFYKFHTFIAVYKINVTINFITVQHKRSFIPVNFDGSYVRVVLFIITKINNKDINVAWSYSIYLFIPIVLTYFTFRWTSPLAHLKFHLTFSRPQFSTLCSNCCCGHRYGSRMLSKPDCYGSLRNSRGRKGITKKCASRIKGRVRA
jgi:hypothetical protein